MHIAAIMLSLGMMLVGAAGLVFWIWTIIDCLTNKRLSDTQKVIWALVIFFLGFIGSLIYFFAGRSPASRVYAPSAPHYYYQQQPYARPLAEQAPAESYRPYHEGYQAQNGSAASGTEVIGPAGENQSAQTRAQYEEIQISYPE
jgi:predicted PurR-regulated permease PerM